MPYLTWISDKNLKLEVEKLIKIAEDALIDSDKKFNKNVVDPFSAVFQISGFKLNPEQWIKQEKMRQSEKTLQNHIGGFHQHILGHVEGWTNLHVGGIADLLNSDEQIIAEIKNKHNTVTGGKLKDLYYDLDGLISPKSSKYKGFKAYFVQIIPKTKERFDIPFTPSDKNRGEKCQVNELIREIDGASFYEKVTGSRTALFDLFKVLPEVLKDLDTCKLDDDSKKILNSIFNSAFGGF